VILKSFGIVLFVYSLIQKKFEPPYICSFLFDSENYRTRSLRVFFNTSKCGKVLVFFYDPERFGTNSLSSSSILKSFGIVLYVFFDLKHSELHLFIPLWYCIFSSLQFCFDPKKILNCSVRFSSVLKGLELSPFIFIPIRSRNSWNSSVRFFFDPLHLEPHIRFSSSIL